MIPPDGFEISKCIVAADAGEVHLALEEGTGRVALLRSYPGQSGPAEAQAELQRLGRLAGPGLPVPIDVYLEGPEAILALAVPDVEPLAHRAERAPDIDECLRIAAELSAAIRHLHSKHWIHCDLNPASVLVAREAPAGTWLLHLDRAVEFGAGGAPRIDADPMYMAPEQFGRMGRGVDFRSDLYSLGATLYHLSTGQPPFPGTDPLALMHAHMAQRPIPPSELRREIPAVFSRLVLKLLAKEPDDRYQTARALHEDLLELQRLWAEDGELPREFPLGTSDAASRPLFSKRLYGRDREIDALAAGLDRVRDGACEAWLVRGAPGSGKSILIEELRTRSLEGGWLVQGKFDLYRRDQPYFGFTAALESLAQQILVRGVTEIETWRKRVEASLGPNCAVLVDWIPDWKFIVGDLNPPPPVDPREAQVRIARTTLRLLEVAARPQAPLILFLDDLQWADGASRFLLREVLSEPRLRGVLLVGTYRTGEVGSGHPLRAVLEEIEAGPHAVHTLDVGPLSRDATLQMLCDAFEKSIAEVGPLADIVLARTENQPFLVQQFIDHMRNLGYITFEPPKGWCWDLEAIAGSNISNDAVELIAARIERLQPHAREVLVFASFIGDDFDDDRLSSLANRDMEAVQFALCALSEAGLIVPTRTGFRFVHDRIREAAQTMRSADERTRLHYDTANLLLEHTAEAQLPASAKEIVEHFNRALSRVTAEKAPKVVQLNVWAAQQAFDAGAPETAQAHVDVARGLAERGDARIARELLFELALLRARCLMLEAEYAEADHVLAAWTEDIGPIDLARATALRIDVYTLMSRESGRWDESDAQKAMEIATAALRKLDVPYPANPGPVRAAIEVLRAYWSLRHVTVEDLLRPGDPPSDRQRAITQLEAAIGALYYIRPNRAIVSCCCRLRRYREGYGDKVLPGVLWTMAIALLMGLRWTSEATRLGELSLELLRRGDVLRPGGTAMGAHYLLFGWLRHPSVTADRIEELTAMSLEEGDLVMVSVGGAIVSQLRLWAGEQLPDVIRSFRASEDLARRAHDPGYRRSFAESAEILECLENTAPLGQGTAPYSAEPMASTQSVLCLFWILMGDCGRAFAAVADYPSPYGIPTHIPFYRALAAAVSLGESSDPDRALRRRLLRADYKAIRSSARFSPRNFSHQRLIIEAELARLRGRRRAALEAGRRAVTLARDARFPLDGALASERVASLLLAMNRHIEASHFFREAIDFYQRWGAPRKVEQIRERHRSILQLAAGSPGEPQGPVREAPR